MAWIFSTSPVDEIALLAEADRLLGGEPVACLDGAALRRATTSHGVDLATAMAYRAFHRDPVNGAFLARLAASPTTADERLGGGRPLLVVPTMYYRERPELGGDGGLVAGIGARFGLRVETAATVSLGSIADNAAILAAHLRTWTTRGWVVTLSKGTADLKRALVAEPALAERMLGWISLAGMPGGTPLAEAKPGRPISHALLGAWLRLRGADAAMLPEMGATHAYSRAHLRLPTDLPVVSVVGMPLASHLRAPVGRSAASLGREGPNDGYVLLEHACLPGLVAPLWGADHYLRTPDLAPLLYRLFCWGLEDRS